MIMRARAEKSWSVAQESLRSSPSPATAELGRKNMPVLSAPGRRGFDRRRARLPAGRARAELESDNPVRPNARAAVRDGGVLQGRSAPAGPDARSAGPLAVLRQAAVSGRHACRARAAIGPSSRSRNRRRCRPASAADKGTRKAPSLVNLAARTILPDMPEDREQTFFWDGRVSSLEHQVLVPIANRNEMGLDHQSMIDRLSAMQGYRPYFREAFGSDDITQERIASALSDYVRTRMSGNAPYDRWSYAGDGEGDVGAGQTRQRALFLHRPLRAVSRRLQLFRRPLPQSRCRMGCRPRGHSRTKDDSRSATIQRDRGAFKTPGLREVSKHAPYMHDGSLATLRDVVEFYNRGGAPNPQPVGPHPSARAHAAGRRCARRLSQDARRRGLPGPGPPKYFPR